MNACNSFFSVIHSSLIRICQAVSRLLPHCLRSKRIKCRGFSTVEVVVLARFSGAVLAEETEGLDGS